MLFLITKLCYLLVLINLWIYCSFFLHDNLQAKCFRTCWKKGEKKKKSGFAQEKFVVQIYITFRKYGRKFWTWQLFRKISRFFFDSRRFVVKQSGMLMGGFKLMLLWLMFMFLSPHILIYKSVAYDCAFYM